MLSKQETKWEILTITSPEDIVALLSGEKDKKDIYLIRNNKPYVITVTGTRNQEIHATVVEPPHYSRAVIYSFEPSELTIDRNTLAHVSQSRCGVL